MATITATSPGIGGSALPDGRDTLKCRLRGGWAFAPSTLQRAPTDAASWRTSSRQLNQLSLPTRHAREGRDHAKLDA